MAVLAACTDKGAKRSVNQDACCIQVADTVFGEVIMAAVCDGVGGLSAGELASATVAYRFAQWFRQELPTLIAGMDKKKSFDFNKIQLVWGVLLTSLNEVIQAYGRAHGERLGTTFTGLLTCGGRYLIGHVGDCRAYQIGARSVRQLTEDQTLVAKQLAEGKITADEARASNQHHVILQSVGTEGMLKPVFYTGSCTPDDLFVMCCDGAYRKAEDAGVHTFFERVDTNDEAALNDACKELLRYDIAHGEKDNLTVVCVKANGVSASGVQASHGETFASDTPVDVAASYGDSGTLEQGDEEDLPTMVEQDDTADEEDLPTMVVPAVQSDDDLPTATEGDEA